ncbi:hypothetical protein GWK47_050120 [Chionoecetes opilio]|uniref:Uncharacterized protein n=1 Tax=Chionoecetes opilio TaxID=41210 RepID=A0A8J4Y2U6_CHIOP|nr:hypothetical protein GWK47_050120 [Chionoecetes opilio]
MEGRIQLCVLVVVMLTAAGKVLGQSLDIKAWMGEEPMTPVRIVNDLVEYFSVRDPHGIPVLNVPEPIHIPGTVPTTQIMFYDPYISGHSKLRLEYVNVNLTTLSAEAKISLPWFNFQGDYEWPGYFSNSEGFANITIVGIEVSLDLFFGIDDVGLLSVNPKMTLEYGDMNLNFTGLNYGHGVVVGAAGTFFSSVIQPLIIGKVQTKVQSLVNQGLEKRLQNVSFPDSISPVDFAVAKLRMDFREQGMEPVKVDDQEINLTWGVTVQLQNIELSGITTLHRTHEISAQFIDSVVYVTIQLGTQAMKGGVDWSLSASLLPGVGGHLSLELESLAMTVELQQPADIRSPPTLRKIDVKLGNFAVRSNGDGTFDYLVEALVNILPNCFRNQIMDKVEPMIHQRVQKVFNRLDVYRMVMNRLAEKEQQQREQTEATA